VGLQKHTKDINLNTNNMKGTWGKIKSLGKFIDSHIAPEYIIIVAYLTTITISLLIEVYTNK
jgi:hypothetical protein